MFNGFSLGMNWQVNQTATLHWTTDIVISDELLTDIVSEMKLYSTSES